MNFSALTTFSIGLVLFFLFCLSLTIQLWYYIGAFSKLAFYKKPDLINFSPPTSIIICARNEADNLAKFLPAMFEQEYPSFEVVVVNDCSYDHTGDFLKEFALQHSNLKIVTIQEDENSARGKKIALMLGIKGAKHEHLLLTDADCKPADKFWLRGMMQHFKPDTDIVIGYGAYEKQKGFLNKMIRFDTFMIALQYLSFALAGKTYMGTGRNLAYKKSLFFKLKGFASHYHIESGDDDLFVNEAVSKHNSSVQVNTTNHTISRVKTSLEDWIAQKRRHITTFANYSFISKLRLVFLAGSQYLFFATFIALLLLNVGSFLIIFLFILRLLIQIIIFKKSMAELGERDLLLLSPVIELILLFIYPLITVSNAFLKKNKWK
jgi:cellulose synthase/poly-beta-1,6-N-acetylglucosamine synthase-like glycosyltransferase